MPVRPTESRLPAGLQTQELGQSATNGNYMLVSYLTQPLRYEEAKKPINNTYVVFDTNTSSTSEPSNYRWKFEFEVEGQNDAIELANLKGVDGGAIFNLNSEEGDFEDALEGKKVTKVITTVALDINATTELVLEQTVEGLDEDIEALIENPSDEKGAVAGEPNTTRKLANDYKDYLIELGGKVELEKVSLNLLATLLYQAIESDAGFFARLSDYLFDPDEEDWMNYANGTGNIDYSDLISKKISILNIKPHIFYYLHKDPVGTNPYQNYVFDEDQESLDSFEEKILSSLDAINSNEKIDLVNRLRFPKSCLYSVWTYLKHLKERHSAYLSNVLDKDNHSTNRECISTVVTEFEVAPQDNLDDPSSTAVQAYDVMYSKWMQAILETSLIQTEIVKIKVIDIRSGAAIRNARVRKLVVYGEQGGVINKYGTNGEVDLLYDRDKIVVNDPLRAAQIALLRLGYAPAAVNREDESQENINKWCDGAWVGQTSQAYNQYWRHRLLNNSMNTGGAAADQPSNIYLREIKNDYNGHAYTDDSGVLEVRIPKIFMDGREIFIDIQFWEIPIVREEISDDSGDPITRNSTDETVPTEFVVSWGSATTTDEDLLAADTTVSVVSTDGFPESGWIKIENEIIEYASKKNTSFRECIRGSRGTVAAQHDNGELVAYADEIQSINWTDYVDNNNQYFETTEFGWNVSKDDRNSKLKVVQRLIVKDDESVFDGYDTSLLSKFYDSDSYPIHFVLFGMVWCQPVWDGIEDASSGIRGAITRYESMVQNSDYSNQNMHIATMYRDLGGSLHYGGKGYGKTDWNGAAYNPLYRGDDGHRGIDVHAKVGALVFAMHSGKITNELGIPGNGNKWKKGRHIVLNILGRAVEYLHLSEFIAELDGAASIMAGTICGKAGRTGNFNKPEDYLDSTIETEWPGHVHFNMGAHDVDQLALRDKPDEENLISIPFNDIPLLIPCACEVTKPDDNPKSCEFNNQKFVNKCWAAAELKCPYMFDKQRNNIFRLGIQLRYLNERPTAAEPNLKPNNDATYIHIGVILEVLEDLEDGGNVNLPIGSILNADILGVGENSWNSGDYRRVTSGGTTGWALRTALGNWNPATKQYTLTAPLNVLLPAASETRRAIYRFRENNGFLKAGNEVNSENYDIEDDEDNVWNRLIELAEVTEPE